MKALFRPGFYALTAAALALTSCQTTPPLNINQAANGGSLAGASCGYFGGDISTPPNAVEPRSGRNFHLEYPCDLGPDESVVLVLNLHGGGSFGEWQRLYFPVTDYASEFRMVVATPTAVTETPFRMWTSEADDQFLTDLSELLISQLGEDNIRTFWLAGHSQGGLTSSRIICSDYFADRVDGFVSLAGGRVGMRLGGDPACDFSHIHTTGEFDTVGVAGIPDTSPLADRFNCDARVRRADIVDTEAGKTYDARSEATGRPPREGWGGRPAPGTAEVFVFPGCDGDRVVADIVRLNKGHTEGLEPLVTRYIAQLMASVPTGKLGSRPRFDALADLNPQLKSGFFIPGGVD